MQLSLLVVGLVEFILVEVLVEKLENTISILVMTLVVLILVECWLIMKLVVTWYIRAKNPGILSCDGVPNIHIIT